MPRLDNSHPEVIEFFELGEYIPGETNPIDVCAYHFFIQLWESLEIDHPPYVEGEYFCAVCEQKLGDADE